MSVDDRLAEHEREEQHLKRSLDRLVEEGDDDPSSKNGMIANNQVLRELRHFKLEGKAALNGFWDEVEEEQKDPAGWWVRGFIVRTRKDGIHTRLDVHHIMKQNQDIAQQNRKLGKKLDQLILMLALCLLMLAYHLFR
jgi:hypothetical protein